MNKTITALITLAILINLTLSQEKWSRDLRAISKPRGTYSSLPTGQENYVNPNKTTRYSYLKDGVITVGPNFRVYPTALNQEDEVILVRHPLNPTMMFGSANTSVGNLYSQGVYVTTNGGANWFGSNILNTSQNSPFSHPGPTIDKNGTIIMTTLLLAAATRMVTCYSTDNGSTWSSLYYLSNVNSDMNFAGTDDAPSSAYYGRSYCVWSNFAANPIPVVVSYTTNGGANWSSMAQINTPPSGHYSQGADIRIGPNGEVYVCWAAPISSLPYTEDFVGFAKSTNGGISWTVTENAYDENGIRGRLFPTNIRVNGFPRIDVDRSGGPRNGWIYIVTAERDLAPAGSDPDVILHRSTNGGTTWSAGIRVNQDPVNNGKIQFFPAIRVDESGAVNIVYYDNRNTTSDSSGVFLSRSTDGGSTWTDIQMSDHNYKPKPDPSALEDGYMGDYIGITSGNGKVWPFWMDDRTNNFQAWTTEVVFSPSPAHDIATGPFLSIPNHIIVNTPYNIKTKVANLGTSNETGVPIQFFVNGTLTNTANINLNSGSVDSVSYSWTPTSTGYFTLIYASALSNDTNRYNDTVRTVVPVLPSVPIIGSNNYCRNVHINIPDITTISDTMTINIPDVAGLIDVNVKIDTVLHSFDGDLSFNLDHLTGSVSLINRRGGSGQNFINTRLNDSATTPISSGMAPFTGEYIPETPLAGFNGLSPNGAWILSITDHSIGDIGELKAWCLTLTYELIIGGIQTVSIPNYYYLGQNYPNPFNPATKISYALPKAGNVELKVYDILGREVATLVNELKQAGIYYADFNATNLASGIYFYSIKMNDFKDVKKMVVVK